MKHLWMECPSCGLKYRNEVYDELVAALRLILEFYDGEHGEPGVIGCQAIEDARAALAKVTNEKTTDQG